MDKIEVKKRADDLGTFQWPLMGYAPGYYMRPCLDCKAVMTHCDKRATQCLSCALASILATRTDATPVAWMPIESAPKDGRSVLVWRDDWGEPVIARWACCYDFLTNAEIAESGLDDEALAKCDWFAADFMQGCRLENDTAPTHWMPFPAAPDATNTHPPATDVAALVEAAKASAEGWANVVEFNLMPMQHWQTANDLQRQLRQALAPFTKGQNDEH